MDKILAIVLLSLSFSLVAAEVPAHALPGEAAANSGIDTNQALATVGGGLLGMLAASGAVGLVSATGMMFEGTGIAESIEAGAGLSMPLAALSAVLGGVFAKDFVLSQINSWRLGETKAAPH